MPNIKEVSITIAPAGVLAAHLRQEKKFRGGAKICPGPKPLWSKMKPFVDVMSRYMTHIEKE